jgi:cephalosporin hydroxylase
VAAAGTEPNPQDIVDEFHRLYHGAKHRTWTNTWWLGVPVKKCPLDLWIYQEILAATRPDLIIETGTAAGGSALFLACMCDLLGSGRVVTIDIASVDGRPSHGRIRYVTGSSIDPDVVADVRGTITDRERVMVILDSDHTMAHVLAELRTYAPLVTIGCYAVVEDTNLNGHPVRADWGQGPHEAVEEFLREDTTFERDRSCEKYFMTFNPDGFLRRRA